MPEIPSILRRILRDKEAEVYRREAVVHLHEMRVRAATAPPARDFRAALAEPGLSLIAEFKRASPSKGVINADAVPEDVARDYEAAGARAMSVLTDSPYFGGADDDLRRARRAVSLPVLRKDFVIAMYQIHEARAMGADAVLLIVAALTDKALTTMLHVAQDLGMAALVETHTEDEIARALDAGAEIIGINNRDLHTFSTTLDTTERLMGHVPDDRIVVSESGIHTEDDIRRLRDLGVDAVLVGESLMRGAKGGIHVTRLLNA